MRPARSLPNEHLTNARGPVAKDWPSQRMNRSPTSPVTRQITRAKSLIRQLTRGQKSDIRHKRTAMAILNLRRTALQEVLMSTQRKCRQWGVIGGCVFLGLSLALGMVGRAGLEPATPGLKARLSCFPGLYFKGQRDNC